MQKAEVSGCLRRVSIMANDRIEGVNFRSRTMPWNCPHTIRISETPRRTHVVYQGGRLEVGFNARYLIDALSAIDTEEVMMELRDEGSPGILKPTQGGPLQDQICIIMPMRI